MSRFLKTLAKVGLVELEPGDTAAAPGPDASAEPDLDRLLAETQALVQASGAAPAEPETVPAEPPPPPVVPEPAAAPPTSPPAPQSATAAVHEGIDLGNIYAAAGVPDAPYPAEKLLRVLDGLAAMDTATRKAAVTAMDAADDDWTLSDPLLDAQRKIRALQSHAAGLQSTVAQAEAQATAALEAQDAYREQAAKRIREQISELEALLADELSTVEAEKARVRAELDNTRSAVARESARFEQEIQRLYSLTQTFGGLASGNEQS